MWRGWLCFAYCIKRGDPKSVLHCTYVPIADILVSYVMIVYHSSYSILIDVKVSSPVPGSYELRTNT